MSTCVNHRCRIVIAGRVGSSQSELASKGCRLFNVVSEPSSFPCGNWALGVFGLWMRSWEQASLKMSTDSQALMVGCVHMVQGCSESLDLRRVALKEFWWRRESVRWILKCMECQKYSKKKPQERLWGKRSRCWKLQIKSWASISLAKSSYPPDGCGL